MHKLWSELSRKHVRSRRVGLLSVFGLLAPSTRSVKLPGPSLKCQHPNVLGWLQHSDAAKYKNPNDLNEAYCKVRKNSLRSHIADLQKHSKSKKHQDNGAVLNRSKYKSMVQHGEWKFLNLFGLHSLEFSLFSNPAVLPYQNYNQHFFLICLHR